MTKEKLSVLIFSRNDVGRAIELVHDIYEIADQIVLVDSSTAGHREVLHKGKASDKLDKLDIFHAIALGYPDPLRMWALKKCRNRWVLLIDTDERLSDALKQNINNTIQENKHCAFGIKRYEDVENGKKGQLFTWQVRLFDKNKVEYKGTPHDQPVISGTVSKLPDEYFMEHAVEFKNPGREYDYEYLNKFERYSYSTYNNMLLDYFGRTTLPESGNARNTLFGRLLDGFLNTYEKITFRKPDEEISNFDYFVYYTVKRFFFTVKKGDFADLINVIPGGFGYIKRIKAWKTEEGGREFFEILKIIYDVGIIKFLELDKESTIERLNREYENRKQGIDLLVLLLRERYKSLNKIK